MHLSPVQLACALLSLALGATGGRPAAPAHHVTRRSFFDLQCNGEYDGPIFTRLDGICDDCYNLLMEVYIYTLCRADCFTTVNFKRCAELLQETSQLELFKTYIKQLHGADPEF